MAAAAAPIFSADVSRPLATRRCSAASFIRTRSIDFVRCALKRQALFGMNDKHAYAILVGWNLLDQCLRRIVTLAGGDANRAFEPLSCRALNVVVDLTTAAAIAADNVAVATRTQFIEVLGSDHAAITDKHNAPEPKALVEVAKDLGHGVGIAPVAGEHVMRDRPSVDQHQANQQLRIARLTVTAVAMSTQYRRPLALEVGRGEIIKDGIDLE